MDKTKAPGIRFLNVILKDINFSRKPKIENEYEININFKSNTQLSDDKKNLIFEINTSLNDLKSNAFNLSFTMVGFFDIDKDNENMPLENFANNNAPALMIPYIREVIHNITLRSGLKPIIIPPLNIISITKRDDEEKKI